MSSSSEGTTPPPINYILSINLRDELEQSGIIIEYIVDIRTKSIRISLSWKYDHNVIVSPFNLQDWKKTVEDLEEELEKKDVEAADIKMIVNTLDANNAMLTEEYIKNEEALTREHEMMLSRGFDEKFEVIDQNIAETFIDDSNSLIAVVEVGDHVENRIIGLDNFKRWISQTYYKYAEEKRLFAIMSGSPFVPSKSASVLDEQTVDKIQAILYLRRWKLVMKKPRNSRQRC